MADKRFMRGATVGPKVLALVRKWQKQEKVSAEVLLAELITLCLEDELRKRPTPSTIGTECAFKEAMNVLWRAKHDLNDEDRRTVVDVLFRLGGSCQVATEPADGPIMKLASYD